MALLFTEETGMQIRKWLAIATLSWGASALSTGVLAQGSLVELIRAGDRDAVQAALQSSAVEVNATEADGSTALHWASYQADRELVSILLEAGAEPNVTNRYGSSPLAEAVKLADIELVRMLLGAGAKPDAPNLDNQTALMVAAHLGKLEIAQLLIEHGASVNAVETFRGQNALMWAAAENHPDVVELLIKHGADVHPRALHDDWPRQMTSEPRAQFRATGGLTALLYATRSGCYRCAVAIVEAGADLNRPNPDGITPLLNAIDSKNFDIAMYLIDKGANVNVWDMHGRTPFYMAIDMNSFRTGGGFGGFGGGMAPAPNQQYTAMDVAQRLLSMGVDVNHQLTRMRPNGPGRGRFADYMMRGGTGPLMVATLSNDHEAIEFLLQNGAEVDLYNVFKTTPLMVAAGMSGTGRGNGPGGGGGGDVQGAAIKTIDLLLAAGAGINNQVIDSHTFTAKLDTYVAGKDNEGRTALHAAAESGWDRVVAHLLEKGADPSIVDAQGHTALDVALAAATAAAAQPNYGGQAKASRDATVDLLGRVLGEAGNTMPATSETL
jgi:uncharacterized protein